MSEDQPLEGDAIEKEQTAMHAVSEKAATMISLFRQLENREADVELARAQLKKAMLG